MILTNRTRSDASTAAPTRPVLRYHGGKWMLAKWVIGHLPSHRIYVEPCGGAASVLLQKPRAYAEVYNDLDAEIVNVFKILRDPGTARQLCEMLRLTPFARDEFRAAYEPSSEPVEQARRAIVRSFMGFSSAATNRDYRTGFRSNANRSGTTPAHDWINYPDALVSFVERLAGVVIENKRAVELIPQHDTPETVFYVDPPYPFSTRSLPKGALSPFCYRHEMTDRDHRDLAYELRSAMGMVVVSGYRCDLYEELFGDWERIDRDSLADGARRRVESLWLNPAAAARASQGRLFAGGAL